MRISVDLESTVPLISNLLYHYRESPCLQSDIFEPIRLQRIYFDRIVMLNILSGGARTYPLENDAVGAFDGRMDRVETTLQYAFSSS